MNQARRKHRHNRLRSRVKGTAQRPRVSVFRSARNIEVQFIDDEAGRTLAAARLKPTVGKTKVEHAEAIGLAAAEAAKVAGIGAVVFDRSGYAYHGRVKAVADAMRSGGLDF